MKKIEQNRVIEFSIFLIAVILAIFGIVSVYSAGSYFATIVRGNSFYFVQRQAGFVVLGIVAAIAILKFVKHRQLLDYRLLQRFSAGMILLLVFILAFIPPINGARGWIPIGPFSFQPLEIAKLILIWATAFYFVESRYLDNLDIPDNASDWLKYWGRHHQEMTIWLIYAGILLAILVQPDTGGFAIMSLTIALMWLASGLFTKQFALKALGIGAIASVVLIGIVSLFGASADYRIRRIIVFLNPFDTSLADSSRQIRNSFYALARGGLTGVGVGNSVQKTGYLPENHTDFILAIIGEELGMLGVLFVLGLLFALVTLIFKRSQTVQRPFDRYMLLGIGLLFTIQIAFNVAGITSLAPLTGVTLPFISYGGSSTLASFIAIGIVLKISIYDRISKYAPVETIIQSESTQQSVKEEKESIVTENTTQSVEDVVVEPVKKARPKVDVFEEQEEGFDEIVVEPLSRTQGEHHDRDEA